MPRVHFVKKARKDNSLVKAGESYFWWKFRRGGKRLSLTRPSRSQLTQSAFLGTMYSIEDDVIGGISTDDKRDEIKSTLEDVAQQVRDLGGEAQDNLDNLPESLQETHMLNERIEMIEVMADELDQASYAFEEEMDEDEFQGAVDDAQGIGYQGE